MFNEDNKGRLLFSIGFYNLENLFDTRADIDTLDFDFTLNGMKKWSTKRYTRKLHKLAMTISRIGNATTANFPVLMGVAEVENETVLNDLINTGPLRDVDYGFVHFDSPDERGIDTALIFHKGHFEVVHAEPIGLNVFEEDGKKDNTRDILYVNGKLNGEPLHIFVNHWPSRRDGDKITSHKRITAAKTLNDRIEDIAKTHEKPNFIIMGDFNDGPDAESVQLLMRSERLYNPMQKLLAPNRGSINYKYTWLMFDQILISHGFFDFQKGTHSFAHADVFDEDFLIESTGKYKGTPYRTFAGDKYIGGYSDHFPVYIQLKYNG